MTLSLSHGFITRRKGLVTMITPPSPKVQNDWWHRPSRLRLSLFIVGSLVFFSGTLVWFSGSLSFSSRPFYIGLAALVVGGALCATFGSVRLLSMAKRDKWVMWGSYAVLFAISIGMDLYFGGERMQRWDPHQDLFIKTWAVLISVYWGCQGIREMISEFRTRAPHSA
ncbi:MAG TPA: hypothetical protein VHC44_01110 [Verrucomicrobiae bacterium]|nr:hypothetical protein [Verrucomicrobiae bacterium]